MPLMTMRPKDALLAQINALNELPAPVTDDNLRMAAPTPTGMGTQVSLPTIAVLGEDFAGHTTFSYPRLDLSAAFFEINPQVATVANSALHQLLPAINQATGLFFDAGDIVDTNLESVAVGQEANITVQAKATSLGYTGSFVIRYRRVRPDLASVVAITALDAFAFPDNVVTKKSVRFVLWNVDFSEHQPLFVQKTVEGKKTWEGIDGIRALMAQQGLANWPAAQANGAYMPNFPTTSLAGANTAFERAWVQTVDEPGYQGTAYLYYNRR